MNRDPKWISLHIFYSSNSDPMLVECVAPLIQRLRDKQLIQRYFFIKYWLEGPHVRLRLRPAPGVPAEAVRAEVEPEVDAFLARRPALYELDGEDMGDFYQRMYVAEYGEEGWDDTYGNDGMPHRPNNSRHYIDYEPEYHRYGGPDGIELAEWHFEKSSDTVLHLLATANVHVRSVLMGLSFQLSMAMCLVFLERPDEVALFLERYRSRWESQYVDGMEDWQRRYKSSYGRMAPVLADRLSRIIAAVRDPDGMGVTPFEREWITHCQELRDRVRKLAADGLPFGGGPDRMVVDPDAALRALLGSFVHMTNNRLGASILDEVYLSYLGARTLNALEAGGSAA
ncbi:thiopeptide-type bacteriocin biosynthesis protein [Acrocarpospora macrocephala]|uniref:Lantibiotic biosynthesis protein n=1 Tax=Acrocarpospora macrocephala TaxID=150177 RepID=A0A5M3WVF4_9ACTN|nr:thiopeptide-type bacteriocin biosynthesis protein [Acrocarpospora macrocephala]GES11969.1 lantibiotic biosynthesis protein [Acrocarpospora macrocephala]